MANKSISGLTASASNLASTDVAPVVQTTGVGPVKMTGLQLAGGLLGSATFNGATVTTSQPVLNLSQTWNAGAVTFRGLVFNATDTASASGSLLLDLQVGGVSSFTVSKNGTINLPSGVGMTAAGFNLFIGDNLSGVRMYPQSDNSVSLGATTRGWRGVFISSSSSLAFNNDTFLSRAAAASLLLGQADAAAPAAQTLQVQSVVAGTSNTAGANWTLKGSAGTGTGAGGSIIFQVAPLGSSGTAQNAYTNALLLDGSAGLATFSGSIINTGDSYLCSHTGASETRGFRVRSTASFSFSSSAASGIPDLLLLRDAANTLALRNGANAQTFNLYQTYTDASNYARLQFGYDGTRFYVDGQAAGTGTANEFAIKQGGTTSVQIASTAIYSAGHIYFFTDNVRDIGASGASRPRNVYVAGSVFAASQVGGTVAVYTASTGVIYFNTRSKFLSPSDGNITMANNAETDFGRLNFGGTTSSFPALKRSSATLQVRLADDSAYAPVEASTVRTATAYTVATLPAAGTAGRKAYVTDATAPTFLGALTGGGAVVTPVFDNGTAWVAG